LCKSQIFFGFLVAPFELLLPPKLPNFLAAGTGLTKGLRLTLIELILLANSS